MAHDGFTLHDLVAYNTKHNDANGESNNDGNNDNFSWNWCGASSTLKSCAASWSAASQIRRRSIVTFPDIFLVCH